MLEQSQFAHHRDKSVKHCVILFQWELESSWLNLIRLANRGYLVTNLVHTFNKAKVTAVKNRSSDGVRKANFAGFQR